MSTREEAAETVRRYIDAANQGDAATIADSFTDDATFTIWGDMPVSGTAMGKQQIMNEFLPAARALFQPGTLQQRIHRVIVDGEQVVAEIQAFGKTAAGKPYENSYCMVFELRDRHISAIREYMDTAYAQRLLYG